MMNKLWTVGVLFCGLVLMAPAVNGQDPNSGPQKPVAPVGAEEKGSSANQAAEGTDAPKEPMVVLDSSPLSGVRSGTLNRLAFNHMSLLPSFSIVSQAERYSNNPGVAFGKNLLFSNYLTGRLGLNRTSGRSQLLVDYIGGGTLTNNPGLGNYIIQSLEVSETVHWGRWSQLFGDQFGYLFESPFGFGGVGGLDAFGTGLGNGVRGTTGSSPSFRPDLLPNQSILLNRSPRISNAAISETDYALSRSTSLTFVGSYGSLKFIDAGFLDSSNVLLQAGFNHRLSRKNSVSVQYRFNAFMFSSSPQRINDQSVQLIYGRELSGRLSFRIGGGPQVDSFKAPLAGSSSSLNWAASSELKYQFGRTAAGFNFYRALTGGSGILRGAETNQFQGVFNRTFNPVWDGTLSLGYAMNEALQQTSIPSAKTLSPSVWFATARVSRRFARSHILFFTYTAQKQSNITPLCALPGCGLGAMAHIVSVGYTWGPRPIVIE
jgi:hypothetical protein